MLSYFLQSLSQRHRFGNLFFLLNFIVVKFLPLTSALSLRRKCAVVHCLWHSLPICWKIKKKIKKFLYMTVWERGHFHPFMKFSFSGLEFQWKWLSDCPFSGLNLRLVCAPTHRDTAWKRNRSYHTRLGNSMTYTKMFYAFFINIKK